MVGTKRSMKNFNPRFWNDTLANFKFCTLADTENKDLNDVALEFAKTINDALDICAPKKTFKIKPNYVPGLTDKAKTLMKSRDLTRSQLRLQKLSATERSALVLKYRRLIIFFYIYIYIYISHL